MIENNTYTTVLLHGWGTSAKTWKSTEDALISIGISTVSMKLPGFDLEDPKEAWDIPEYACFVLSTLEQMHIKPPYNFIGHSFGGRISIYIASYHPEFINKLVLTSAAGVADRKEFKTNLIQSQSVKELKNLLKEFIPEQIYDYLLKIYIKIMGSADYKRATPIMRKTLQNVVDLDLTPFLQKIKAPALIIWGDKDNLTPLCEGEKLHRNIKSSNFIVIEGAGHNTHITHSKEWLDRVIQFLE
jgi:pimeloyl-ACP methyl ester carboxylesterase